MDRIEGLEGSIEELEAILSGKVREVAIVMLDNVSYEIPIPVFTLLEGLTLEVLRLRKVTVNAGML